jgi:hypothetical protein
MNNPLILLAIQELPALIARFREIFAAQHPDEPVPSDAEVVAAYESAYQLSVAKDEAWLAAHPEDAPTDPPVEP